MIENHLRDGFLLASLPSSGSDWFASCVAAAGEFRYAREYFCPAVNWRHAAAIEAVLGDGIKLARPVSRPDLEWLLKQTWRKSGYEFTKDLYLTPHLDRFAETFSVFVLVRRFEDTFPPRRRRVMFWYERLFASLPEGGWIRRWSRDRALTPMRRAAVGHYHFTRKLIEFAERCGRPCFWFDRLTRAPAEQVRNDLRRLGRIGETTAERVIATRADEPRPCGEWAEMWRDAREFYTEIETTLGPIQRCTF